MISIIDALLTGVLIAFALNKPTGDITFAVVAGLVDRIALKAIKEGK